MSNVTTLVCDIVPLWSGYVWGAQVRDNKYLSNTPPPPPPPPLGRSHLGCLLTVPGDGATLLRSLLRSSLPTVNPPVQHQHSGKVGFY